jgi:quinol monooxygenase YgiN
MDELRELLADLTRGTLAEPECLGYRVLTGEDATECVLIGTWTGEAGLRAHYGTEHYRRYRENVGPFLARPSDVTVHYVSQSVHASDPNPPDPGLLG